MSSNLNYQFLPAITCWIKHLQEGKFNPQDKSLFTIFGSLKRVKIVATIIQKEEFISKRVLDKEDFTEDTNINYRFILDDGTGIIYAIKWFNRNVVSNNSQFALLYNSLKKGDKVNAFGKVSNWNDKIQISIESLNKLDNPNYSLFHDANIIKKLKSNALFEIPTDIEVEDNENLVSDTEEEFLFNSISNNIDIDELFSNSKGNEKNQNKEKVYNLIKQYSQDGNGITFSDLKKKLSISEEKLRAYIEDLEMESRIYQSGENLYQSF